jgi:hypothetical protein
MVRCLALRLPVDVSVDPWVEALQERSYFLHCEWAIWQAGRRGLLLAVPAVATSRRKRYLAKMPSSECSTAWARKLARSGTLSGRPALAQICDARP